MPTAAQTFMSRIIWDPSFSSSDKTTITNVLNDILATSAGATLVNSFTDPNATIDIVNNYGLGSHELTSVSGGVTTYTLKYDFAQIGSAKYVDSSDSISIADAAEVVTHEFTHMSGLTDSFSTTNSADPTLIGMMTEKLGVPPYVSDSPNVEFTNIIKDQMRAAGSSVQPDRKSYDMIGLGPSTGSFSGATITDNDNGDDISSVSISGYSGLIAWDQLDNSLLLGPETGGNSLNIDFGGWSNVSLGTGSTLDVSLTDVAGNSLGTLDYNPSGTSSFTLTSGLQLALATLPTNALISSSLSSSTTPESTLLSDLTALGDSISSSTLNTDNFNYLNPTGSTYTVSGSISGSTDTFIVTGAPGAHVTGATGKTNILDASGDIVQDSISNIQQLSLTGALTLTASELSAFGSVTGAGSLTLASSGSFSAAGLSATISAMTAEDWGGTTLTGSSTNGQVLTASLYGNDTLTAGNGTGDILIAGEGVDTMTGGTGGDKFEVGDLAAGSSITGHGSGNTIETGGDISGATVTDVQTLQSSGVTLDAAELSGFTTITTGGSGLILNASGAGSFSMASYTISGNLTMNADASDSETLIGNDAGNNTLSADDSDADDTLTVSDTTSGANTLTAQNSGGDNTLTAGDGAGDVLNVNGSFGDNTLSVGNGASDQLLAEDSSGDNTLTGGSGGATFNTTDSSGTNTMHGGSGADNFTTGLGASVITGGGGGDTFNVNQGLASGSSISDTGTGNVMNVDAPEDISGATSISGVQTLDIETPVVLTVNSSEVSAFGTIDALGGTVLQASGAGTFSLAGVSVDIGGSPAVLTMVADAAASDTLIAGNTESEVLNANNTSGADTLEGTAEFDTLEAQNSSGNDTLTMDSGTITGVLDVSGSTGTDTLTAASGDTLYAGLGDDTLIGTAGADTFVFSAKAGAGTTVTGDNAYDLFEANGISDISGIGISAVPGLEDYSPSLTLTASQFSEFTTLSNPSGSTETLVIIGSGSYSLSGKSVVGSFTLITDSGSSITGNNANGQVLYAASTGSSTVTAGSGTGDVLIAGSGTDTLDAGSGGDTLVASTGTDTLTGGSGNDNFVVGNTLASGDTLNGGSGTNGIQVAASGASLAAATISNITSLEIEGGASTTVTHSQFTALTTFIADSGAGALSLSGAGTYSLASDTVDGNLALTATGSGNYTLTGNNSANQTLNGSTGTDAIATGTGSGDTVNANGVNDFVTLNGDDGTANINDASGAWTNANGASDLINDDGTGDTINASGDSAWINSNGEGQSITTSGAYATVNVNGASTWVNVTGDNDTISADGDYDNITLNASDDWVFIDANSVTVALDGSDGNVTAETGADSTNAWILMNTANNVATLDGTDGGVTASANNEWVNVNGTGNVVSLDSTDDTAYLTGASEDAWINISGSGDGTNGTGTGNTFNISSSSNTVGGGGDTFILANGLSDTLNGGASDTYEFGSTFGSDTINNTAFGSATTANGKLTFGSGVTDEKLWFKQSGNNLLIDLLGTTDQITIDNWFGSNAGAQLSEIDAGSLKLTTAVSALVTAMATYAAAHTGFNPQTSGTTMPTDTTLQNAIAGTGSSAWHS